MTKSFCLCVTKKTGMGLHLSCARQHLAGTFTKTNMLRFKFTITNINFTMRYGDALELLSSLYLSYLCQNLGVKVDPTHWNFLPCIHFFKFFLLVWVRGRGHAHSSGDITPLLTLHVLSMTSRHLLHLFSVHCPFLYTCFGQTERLT